jgi:hypothetical protein
MTKIPLKMGTMADADALLPVFNERLGGGFGVTEATSCYEALQNRQHWCLKSFGIQAVSIYEQEEIRIYRLQSASSTLFVRCYPPLPILWAENLGLLVTRPAG